nr:hypothetical protein [uncultured Desulfobacter sp.]
MLKIDSQRMLIGSAKRFEPYLGNSGTWRQGKIFFPALPYSGSLSFVRKSSLISANYFLSLQAVMPPTDTSDGSNSTGRCYLNRLGVWRIKGSDKTLTSFYQRIKEHTDVAKLCKITDFDALILSSENSETTLFLNLYGGGYLSLLFPPMQFQVAISDEQIRNSAEFFKTLVNILADP